MAVITGAASGIGLATVELFIEEGVRVFAADLQEDAGRALEQRFPGVLRFARCDVTEPPQILQAIDSAAEHFGGLDILFSNAGAVGSLAGVENWDAAAWDCAPHKCRPAGAKPDFSTSVVSSFGPAARIPYDRADVV